MHQPERPDHLDHDARRRAAEAAAQAAEARAAVAAAEARAAIAAAAHAAAAADAAAQAAEDAAARVVEEFGARSRDPLPGPVGPVPADATRPVPVPLHPVAPARPVPSPAARPTPVPAPLPERGARHGDAFSPIADRDAADAPDAPEPATTALPAVRRVRPATDTVGEGRAARRRAADGLDPATGPESPEIVALPAPGPEEDADATRSLPARRHRAVDGPDGAVGEAAQDVAPRRRRPEERSPDGAPTRAARRARAASRAASGGRLIAPNRVRRPQVLVAAAAGGVLVLGAIALGTGMVGAPQPAAVMDTTVPVLPGAWPAPAPAPASAAADPAADPVSNRAAAFVEQLRLAGVPTSRAGTAEVEAADLVCDQLAGGMDRETLARALPASLPTVSRSQAAELIDVAQAHYCE